MHQVDDVGEHAGVGVGQHAVAEVEDVPARGPALLDHPAHLAVDRRPVGEQHGGVEVALQRPPGPDPAGGLVERHPPVDADDVGAGVADQRQQLAGADAEVDARHVPMRPAPSKTARECGSTRSA